MKLNEIKSVRAGQPRKAPGGYVCFIPNALPPELEFSPALIRAVSEADMALGELAGIGRVLINPYVLVYPSIRKEAELSSKIEGTLTDISDLFGFEVQGEKINAPTDVKEVHNYVRALEYGLERLNTFPLSLRLVKEIHQVLMAGVRGNHSAPGEFRSSHNWIGPPGSTLENAAYVPPTIDEMNSLLTDWEAFHYKTPMLPDIVRLAILHAQFEMIHPFVDGNGRIGRLLIVLLLCHWQILPLPTLFLSAYFERNRSDYYQHLFQVSHQGKWEEWVLFFVQGIKEQSHIAVQLSKDVLAMSKRLKGLVINERKSTVAVRLVDQLFMNPYVTIASIRVQLDVTYNAAANAVGLLERLGILKETTGAKRNRVWLAQEILSLFSRG